MQVLFRSHLQRPAWGANKLQVRPLIEYACFSQYPYYKGEFDDIGPTIKVNLMTSVCQQQITLHM